MFRRPPRSTRTDTLLPDTTLFRSRTDATMKRMAELAMEVDGITHEIAFPGLNPLQFSNTPNNGVVFFTLAPFSERSRSAEEISAELNAKLSTIQEGFTFAFMPPPIQGLGNGSGWSLFVEDRTALGYGALQDAVQAFQGAASQTPGLGFPITSYQANVPQLDAVSSEEHTSELQSLMRSSYAVFCLTKKNTTAVTI